MTPARPDHLTLLLMRHAKSSWSDEDLEDHERPLNKRGARDAPRMGRLLHKLGLEPGIVLCSTAKRARATARRVLKASGYDPEIQFRAELYQAEPGTLIARIRAIDDSITCAMLVGHNPELEMLLTELTGAEERLPTGALAQIKLGADDWSQVTAGANEIVAVFRPRELHG